MAGSKVGNAPQLVGLNQLLKSKLKLEEVPLIFITDKQWAAWQKGVKAALSEDFKRPSTGLLMEIRPMQSLGGCIVAIKSQSPKLKAKIIPSLSTKSKLVVAAVPGGKFTPWRPSPVPSFPCGIALVIGGGAPVCYGKCEGGGRLPNGEYVERTCVGQTVLVHEAVYGLKCSCHLHISR